MSREQRMLQALQVLKPIQIELKNDSEKHSGHTHHLGGAGFTGETHYKLTLVSPLFDGVSRIDRQRMVMDLLKEEFNTGLHALEIKAKASNEA